MTGTAGAALGFERRRGLDNTGQPATPASTPTPRPASSRSPTSSSARTRSSRRRPRPATSRTPSPARSDHRLHDLDRRPLRQHPRPPSSWLKHDGNGQLLGGADVHRDRPAAPLGFSADVADNTGQAGYTGLDTDTTAGEFTIAETSSSAPTRSSRRRPRPATSGTPSPARSTITGSTASISIPFVNTLGELRWTKDKGDAGRTPLGGATFSVTPEPVHRQRLAHGRRQRRERRRQGRRRLPARRRADRHLRRRRRSRRPRATRSRPPPARSRSARRARPGRRLLLQQPAHPAARSTSSRRPGRAARARPPTARPSRSRRSRCRTSPTSTSSRTPATFASSTSPSSTTTALPPTRPTTSRPPARSTAPVAQPFELDGRRHRSPATRSARSRGHDEHRHGRRPERRRGDPGLRDRRRRRRDRRPGHRRR